jgi:alpha-L-fucosidase
VVRELLTQYGPIAAIWLDGIGSYYTEPEAYRRLDELYALIRTLQPQCLISFKQGTGKEDFVAPEGLMHAKNTPIAQKAWELNRGKPGEICTMMQTAPPAWLYLEGCEHIDAAQVLALLVSLNIAPTGGSLDSHSSKRANSLFAVSGCCDVRSFCSFTS